MAIYKTCFFSGSGCDSVGTAVASESRDPRFESSHWQTFIEHLFTVNFVEKTKVKKKEVRNCPFLNKQNGLKNKVFKKPDSNWESKNSVLIVKDLTTFQAKEFSAFLGSRCVETLKDKARFSSSCSCFDFCLAIFSPDKKIVQRLVKHTSNRTHQCDQMVCSILAIYNDENLPNIITKISRVVSTFCQILP